MRNTIKRKLWIHICFITAILAVTLSGCTSTNQDPARSATSAQISIETINTATASSYASTSLSIQEDMLLSVHFIDVGQGDAVLINSKDFDILIDGGKRGTVVTEYLKKQGIGSLDLIVSTHPHADHIGGLINVLESIPVKEVLDPGVIHTTKTFEDYLTLIDKKNIKFTQAKAGMKRDLSENISMEIFNPIYPSEKDINNSSVVIRISYGVVSFLFEGDAEAEAESQMLEAGSTLNSTILKIGHHGSRTSSSSAYLKAVYPKVGIIMCGIDNTYGHPHPETLTKLSDMGIKTYRTDINGTIVITTDGKTYDITTQKKGS